MSSQALEYEQFKLDNGMRVVVIPDHRSPVVVHSVWYKAGSADEPNFRDKKTGIAHMLEHLMFKGTDTIPPGEMSKIVARNGGRDNAFTSYDYTAYFQTVATDRLPLMMEMEGDRMGNLKLTDKEFQPERDVVLEERFMREESTPMARFFEKLIKVHYDGHPYANPIIGWREDIEGYTVQDAIDWYDANYAPDNATMVLVGDVTADEVKPMVEKYYGVHKPHHKEAKPWSKLPEFKDAKEFVAVDKEVQVPVFYRLYRAGGIFAGMGEEAPISVREAVAATVMSEVLGNPSTGRLYNALVEEKKIADAASADYDAISRGEPHVGVYVQPKAGVTLDVIEKAVEEEIAKLIKNGISDDEFNRIKTAMKSRDVYQQDDPFHMMYRLGSWITTGGTPETFDDWLIELDAINADEAVATATKYLVKKRSTTGYLISDESQMKAN